MKCKICGEPSAKEAMSEENQQHLINIFGEGVIKAMRKLCMRCIVINMELNNLNLQGLRHFNKYIQLLIIKEKGK